MPDVRVLAVLVLAAACGGSKSTPVADPPEPDVAAPGGPDAQADNPGEVTMAEIEEHMDPIRATVKECAARTVYEGKVTVHFRRATE